MHCVPIDHDYLYRDDLESFVTDGTLTSLYVAFSRAPTNEKKIYVQDLMKLHDNQLINLIVDQHAFVFVCG
jgi:sulfite reductase alpha subunit-like flavoprotein